MEEKKEVKKYRCEKCGSAFGYPRVITKDFKCRKCWHETKMEEKKE